MYIQYRGFSVATNSRTYNFQVLDPSRAQRAFTVKIQSDTNHWASLKLQDGPGIPGNGSGPFFVEIGEDLQDRFPGEFVDVILGGGIIDPQHAKDAIGTLHVTAHPI